MEDCEVKMIIAVALLFALNWFGKYMCDLIKFKPHLFGSDWMLAVGKYSYDKRGILRKGILSFLSDGWHLFDSVRNMSVCLIVCVTLNVQLYWAVILYALYGLLFNILYKIWKR